MKYIIELEDAPISVKNSHKGEAYDVYLAKKFNTVFFDAEGLRRLEPYESQSAYQKGYEAGLAEGRKQAEEHDGCQGCYYEPCGEDEEPCMSCKYRYKSQYRRADDKIRVGDEVIAESSERYGNAVVTNAKTKEKHGISMQMGLLVGTDLTGLLRQAVTSMMWRSCWRR